MMLQNPRQYTKYTFFWSGPFSNWADSPFHLDGIYYGCVEQYMMVKKALLFNDTLNAELIMATDSPRKQKEYGRQVVGFDMNIWAVVARDIVKRGNAAKYSQNYDLYDNLMETTGTLLVEASPSDKVWGIGLGAREAAITPIEQWQGSNWLGQVLTEVRDEFEAAIQLKSKPIQTPLTLNHE